MPSYTPPLRDMQFVMNEVLDVPGVLKSLPTHAELDADTITAVSYTHLTLPTKRIV